ncbi:hypothetical protein AVEN_179625-1 [Araneus ventricosus]|uniref:Uncharacterized protein n=1 Tax=Araneus ventricosus TaxID=182803 RepID=A0A4Y2BEX5_ARAVE|nr:hypothetical protein AVEN_179625-1 [Araneus ventricosus]
MEDKQSDSLPFDGFSKKFDALPQFWYKDDILGLFSTSIVSHLAHFASELSYSNICERTDRHPKERVRLKWSIHRCSTPHFFGTQDAKAIRQCEILMQIVIDRREIGIPTKFVFRISYWNG